MFVIFIHYLHRTGDNDLTDYLPEEIGQLKNLVILNLHGNSFGGSIPSELSQLSKLTKFVISGNKFKGSVPAQLGQVSRGVVSKVEFIDIGHNLLTGFIPLTFNYLENLSTLYMWGNELTGNINFLCDLSVFEYDPGEFDSACTYDQKSYIAKVYQALKKRYRPFDPECGWDGITCNNNGAIININLAGEELDGSIPGEIGQIFELQNLNLSDNKLIGSVPAEIESLLFLKSLNLRECLQTYFYMIL